MLSARADGRGVDLSAMSLATGKRMWSETLPLDSASVRVKDLALRRLPHVLDLNHDDKAEIVAPYEQSMRLLISVIDADTGRPRWEQTISPSSQSHWQYFLQYPDINGDGHDELVVVSECFLNSERYGYASSQPMWPRVFVDVLSGKDGRSLSWWQGPKFDPNQRRIESVEFGLLGSDGRPELMITTVVRYYAQISSLRDVYLVSAARGVETHRLESVHATRLADFNGDGLSDIFSSRETRDGMQLQVLAGAAPEAWRRLGDLRPAQDYNRDGVTDAVEVAADKQPRLRLISGRDGRVMSQLAIVWRDRRIAEIPIPIVTAPPPAHGDLDGDGIADLLVAAEWRVPFRMQSQPFPLMAISGATGRRVWDSPTWTMGRSLREQDAFGLSIIELKPFCADLDWNGAPEIVCPHRIFWHGQGQNSGFITQVCLTVIGKDGRVVWTEALGKPVETSVMHEYQLPYAVSPDLEDLNGDGTADLVVTVPDYRTPGSIQDISCDVWAVSGRDGAPFWTQPLKRVVPPYYVQNNQLATAAVGDLDADGKPEIAIADVDNSNAANELVFRLLVLGGNDGKLRWEWSWKHPANSMAYMPAVVLAELDGDGRKAVGVRFFDQSPDVNKDTLVFFDAAGNERLRITGAQEWEYNPRAIEVRASDLTADGKADVSLMTGRSVKAFDNTGKLHWETPASGWMPIEDIVPGKTKTSPTLVIGKDHTYFGVEGSTGKVVWRGEGIRPDAQSSQTETWCLTSRQGSDVPRIMSRRDHVVSRITLPTDAAGRILSTAGAAGTALTTSATSGPDRIAGTGDPRLLRRLPWDYPHGPAADLLVACGFSLVLVVIPCTWLYRMVRARRWGIRTLLILPLLVAVMISLIYVFAKLPVMRRSDNPYLHVAILAISGTMALPFFWLILLWSYKRRWIRLGLLVGTSLGFAFVVGVIGYLNAARLLDPLEKFEWTWRGIWNIWLPIAIVTGWVALVVVSLVSISRRFRRATTKMTG